MVKGKWVLTLLGVATGVFVAFSLFPGEETKVKKRFSLLAEYASKADGEKILAMAEKMRNLEFLFSEPCTVEAPPYALSGSFNRAEIAGLAARARLHFSYLTLEFHDLSVSFPEKETARAVLTGRVKGKTVSGEAVHEVREMECVLKKREGQWFFENWEVVEVLKR
jgi:hypothetical protein